MIDWLDLIPSITFRINEYSHFHSSKVITIKASASTASIKRVHSYKSIKLKIAYSIIKTRNLSYHNRNITFYKTTKKPPCGTEAHVGAVSITDVVMKTLSSVSQIPISEIIEAVSRSWARYSGLILVRFLLCSSYFECARFSILTFWRGGVVVS